MLNDHYWSAPITTMPADRSVIVSHHLYWFYHYGDDSFQLRNDILVECNSARIPRRLVEGKSRREVIGELIVDMWIRAKGILSKDDTIYQWYQVYARELLGHLKVMWDCNAK